VEEATHAIVLGPPEDGDPSKAEARKVSAFALPFESEQAVQSIKFLSFQISEVEPRESKSGGKPVEDFDSLK